MRSEVEGFLKKQMVQTVLTGFGFLLSVGGIWGDGVTSRAYRRWQALSTYPFSFTSIKFLHVWLGRAMAIMMAKARNTESASQQGTGPVLTALLPQYLDKSQ